MSFNNIKIIFGDKYMKNLFFTSFLLLNISTISYAIEYNSEVVCNITKNNTIIKSIRHDLWHDYEMNDTWEFEISTKEDIYEGVFKLDERNAYIELKEINSNIISSKLADFSIGQYPPSISVKIKDVLFICRAHNDTNSKEWEMLLSYRFDLPLSIFNNHLGTLVELADLTPKTDDEEKVLNQSLCYLLGGLEHERNDLYSFILTNFISRKDQFPNVLDFYIQNILNPAFKLSRICTKQIDRSEVSKNAKEISKSLINISDFIHSHSIKSLLSYY